MVGGGLYVVVVLVGLIVGGIYAIVNVQPPAASPAVAAETLTFEDMNFRFKTPGKPFVSIDVKKINADATFGLLRTNPTTMLIVIAERGEGLDLDTAGLVERARPTSARGGHGADCVGDAAPIRGLDGVLFCSDRPGEGAQSTYGAWVTSYHGYLYQLSCSANRRTGRGPSDADMPVQSFELIARRAW